MTYIINKLLKKAPNSNRKYNMETFNILKEFQLHVDIFKYLILHEGSTKHTNAKEH